MKELFRRIWTDPKVGGAVLAGLLGALVAVLMGVADQGFSWGLLGGALTQFVTHVFGTRSALYAESPLPEYPKE